MQRLNWRHDIATTTPTSTSTFAVIRRIYIECMWLIYAVMRSFANDILCRNAFGTFASCWPTMQEITQIMDKRIKEDCDLKI